MKVKIDCPMCSFVELEEDICPNCDTNLFLYRTLLELPTEDKGQKHPGKKWLPMLPIKMAILCVLMGIGLTTFVNSLLAGQKKSSVIQSSIPSSEQTIDKTPTSAKISSPVSSEEQQETTETTANSNSCGGFYYTVRKGNSLSLIASRFYGDGNSWSHIITANPQLRGREDLLKIGEVLLITNLDRYCGSELS